MGAIQLRKAKDGTVSYRALVRMRGAAHQTQTFSRKTDARDWIRRIEESIKNGNAQSVEAGKTTLNEALNRYAREITPRKKSRVREEGRIRIWQTHPFAHRFLSALRGSHFAAYRDARRAEGVAEQTIRLELALISHLYTTASKDWGMEGLRNPIKLISLPGGSRQRARRLEEGEEEKLLIACAAAPYLAPLVSLAIETAMRQGELLSLTWGDLDSDKRIAHLKDTKNAEPRDVPISSRAMQIIRDLPRPLDDGARIFPLTRFEVQKAFFKACTRAGITDFRFHDLRHEAVSRLFERGLNVAEVAAISGHKTWSQLKRYTRLRAKDLAQKLA